MRRRNMISVGEQVKVVSDITMDNMYDGSYAYYEMTKYAGDTVTICSILEEDGKPRYRIHEDGGASLWSESMFSIQEEPFDKVQYSCEYELYKAYPTDSGYDIRTIEDIVLDPFETLKVDTGLKINLAEGYEAQVRPRSGLSSRGMHVHLGTIDQGYTGQIKVNLTNLTTTTQRFKSGTRIAQLVIAKRYDVAVEKVDEFTTQTERGANGFGSTGEV